MQALHQKNLLEQGFPFNLFITEDIQFPPHWHDEVEMIYVLDGRLKVGVNNEIYELESRDILLIGGRDVHYFMPQQYWSKIAVIQFGISIFDAFSIMMQDKKFSRLLFGNSKKLGNNKDVAIHKSMEEQILLLMQEYRNKQDGYQIALKARLYDLLVILIRKVPMEEYSLREKNKLESRLERLGKVFEYVEAHYEREISLEEIARVANFSTYHFARFFREATGMTFGQYLSNFRIKKAEWHLANSDESITQLAFKSGFNSVKTFNRVFKSLKGCSPSQYKKSNI